MPADITRDDSAGVGWARIFEAWAFVESGFHSMYGTDLSHARVRRSRSWRWFRVRLAGLMASDTPLARMLAPQDDSSAEPVETDFS